MNIIIRGDFIRASIPIYVGIALMILILLDMCLTLKNDIKASKEAENKNEEENK